MKNYKNNNYNKGPKPYYITINFDKVEWVTIYDKDRKNAITYIINDEYTDTYDARYTSFEINTDLYYDEVTGKYLPDLPFAYIDYKFITKKELIQFTIKTIKEKNDLHVSIDGRKIK